MSSKRIEILLILLTFLSFFINILIFIGFSFLLFLFYFHREPYKTLPLIVFLLFTEMAIPVSYLPLPITLTKYGMILLLLLSFKYIKRIEFRSFFIILSIFVFYIMIYLLFDFNFISFRWTFTIFSNMFMLFLFYQLLRQNEQFQKYFIYGLFIAILTNSLLAIYQEFSHGNTLYQFGINNSLHNFTYYANYVRVSGFFQNTNLLNSFIIPTSFLIYPLVEKKYRILFVFPFIAFLFTFSRSGWLIIIIAFLIISYLYSKKFFIVFIAIIMIFLLSPFSKRFFQNDAVKSVYYSDLGRKYSYKVAIDFIKKHPYIGIGPGQLYENFDKYAPDYLPWKKFFTHNTFLSMTGEWGIIGFLFLLSLFIYGFFILFKIQKREKIFYVIGLFALFFLSFFFDLQWEIQFWIVFLIIILIERENETVF